MKPKFIVGDIVNLLPWDDFINHSGISKYHWDKCFKKNPVTIVDTHNNCYYLSDGYGFIYDEDHLMLVGSKDYLPEELFEI